MPNCIFPQHKYIFYNIKFVNTCPSLAYCFWFFVRSGHISTFIIWSSASYLHNWTLCLGSFGICLFCIRTPVQLFIIHAFYWNLPYCIAYVTPPLLPSDFFFFWLGVPWSICYYRYTVTGTCNWLCFSDSICIIIDNHYFKSLLFCRQLHSSVDRKLFLLQTDLIFSEYANVHFCWRRWS